MMNPTPSSSVTYRWNTAGCYTNSRFTGSSPQCFPHNQTTQNVTGNNLDAEDAGTITCTVTISGSNYTSGPLTLRISGEQLMYCVITCIVYCKQCMLLLLATYYCCIMHQLLWFMYRVVFTTGVVVTDDQRFASATALTDYSYITASGSSRMLLARCLTGLGPNGTVLNANDILGGWYFNGTKRNNGVRCPQAGAIIQPISGANVAGLIALFQCRQFTTDTEGVYTCTISNSSMMDQSVRLGIYLDGRSESLIL